MGRSWLLAIALLIASGCSPAYRCRWSSNGEPALHVLFIGNSYTFTNDLPGTFSRLACSGGYRVESDMAASPGWTLADHAASPDTLDLLNREAWDLVILQEQSEIPAIEDARRLGMYPSARLLVGKIREAEAEPMFFLTWGHRAGLPEHGIRSFWDMQAQLSVGYRGIAEELDAPVVPVGNAWQAGMLQPDPIDLWQGDGSHPSQSGTYLAACVFYAKIFEQSPEGLAYRDGLSEEAAARLQALAAEAVLK